MEILQEIKGYNKIKVSYTKPQIVEEKEAEFLEEQIRTKPPIEEDSNDEKIQ